MDKYLPDVVVPDFDPQISSLIKSLNIDVCNHGRFTIGFRNGDGIVYRKIRVEGLGNVMRFTQAVPKHGYNDELVDQYVMREGCDAIYSKI